MNYNEFVLLTLAIVIPIIMILLIRKFFMSKVSWENNKEDCISIVRLFLLALIPNIVRFLSMLIGLKIHDNIIFSSLVAISCFSGIILVVPAILCWLEISCSK